MVSADERTLTGEMPLEVEAPVLRSFLLEKERCEWDQSIFGSGGRRTS